MENNTNFDNFYKQLTEDEQQICDLCRDWNFGSCEECEFVSRFASNKEQEVINATEKHNKDTQKEWRITNI